MERRARVSDLTLRHELEVMDVKAALVSAISETANLSVAEFSTWPLLYQFTAARPAEPGSFRRQPTVLKPDGFIRLGEETPDGITVSVRRTASTFVLQPDAPSRGHLTGRWIDGQKAARPRP